MGVLDTGQMREGGDFSRGPRFAVDEPGRGSARHCDFEINDLDACKRISTAGVRAARIGKERSNVCDYDDYARARKGWLLRWTSRQSTIFYRRRHPKSCS